jgi:hypothetical protein
MNKIVLPFFLAFLVMPAWAKKHEPAAPCQTEFTVVKQDSLKNVTQGLSQKGAEWFEKNIQKKYPDVCYVAPGPNVHLVFFISVTPDVYHGTRVEHSTETHDSPVSGTVTDEDGNRSNIDGTVKTTTTSSTAVPYDVPYGIFTLTVKTSEAPGKWTVRHRFQQRGLYNTLYGIPLGGKGHHPDKAVLEEAAKWVHEGGLTNPLETVAPQ